MATSNLPEDVLHRVNKAREALVPIKSKVAYEKEFDNFKEWSDIHDIAEINEMVLLGYFQELSENFAPNSLWTKYSMLKKQMMAKKLEDISETFLELEAFLKQNSKNYVPKKSKVLSREQVVLFLKTAPVDESLLNMVILMIGIFMNFYK